MDKQETLLAKITHEKIGWRVVQIFNPVTMRTSKTARPVCRTCEMNMTLESDRALKCPNPICKNEDKILKISKPYEATKQIVYSMWEAKERKKEKGQWLNFDQELIKLAKGEDSSEDYWCKVNVLNTKQGKMAMVLIGKKGHTSKIQFFVKDELDQVTFDQIGDINPKELLMAFKAQFSDGSITETKYQ